MSRIQMLNVSFETQDGRTLMMQRYTQPDGDQKLLLQKPLKIYRGQLKK